MKCEEVAEVVGGHGLVPCTALPLESVASIRFFVFHFFFLPLSLRPILRPFRRPFLLQSDSASRKRPCSTGLFFNWILLDLLFIVSRVDFIVFVLFLEAVGVRGSTAVQQSKSVGSSVLRAFSASNGSANPRPSELVALGLAESRQSYVRGVALG